MKHKFIYNKLSGNAYQDLEEKYNLNKMKANTDDNQVLCAINTI